MHAFGGAPSRLDRWYPWLIVVASLTMIVVGQGIQFVLSVSLKAMTADLGWPRQVPSLAYAASMVCAGIGALYLGRLSDRIGMGPVALIGAVMIPGGAVLTSFVTEPWQLYLVFGLMIGLLGNATIFAPLMANTTRWFDRNRGLALGIVASGQSLGGTIWPPIATILNVEIGWRGTFLWYGVAALILMMCMTLVLRRRAPGHAVTPPRPKAAGARPARARVLGWPAWLVQAMLCGAIVGCCVPMALPLVHLVPYASDIGFSPGAAAGLLSVALATSFISRVGGGMLADRIGGLRTVFIGSAIQAAMLAGIATSTDLTTLYGFAAVFGLGYGGIIAMYAFIVREYFPAEGLGAGIAVVYLFGTIGMALGGWTGGFVHDLVGTYQPAFLIGVAFNVGNLLLIGALILRTRRFEREPLAA
ncbi:MAG: MFS transporter [Alphaproteobacteria bacterium]